MKQEKNFPNNLHMDNYSEELGWEFLGSDSEKDYYINHKRKWVSVVYGEAPWEYVSHPYEMLKDVNALDKPLQWSEAIKYCEICKARLLYPDNLQGICEPCSIYMDDHVETFELLGCLFDIGKARKMISSGNVVEKGQVGIKDIWKWMNVISVDHGYASKITEEQMKVPVIIAKFLDQDLLVDGYHRLAKAISTNKETLPFVSIYAQDILKKER